MKVLKFMVNVTVAEDTKPGACYSPQGWTLEECLLQAIESGARIGITFNTRGPVPQVSVIQDERPAA